MMPRASMGTASRMRPEYPTTPCDSVASIPLRCFAAESTVRAFPFVHVVSEPKFPMTVGPHLARMLSPPKLAEVRVDLRQHEVERVAGGGESLVRVSRRRCQHRVTEGVEAFGNPLKPLHRQEPAIPVRR